LLTDLHLRTDQVLKRKLYDVRHHLTAAQAGLDM
jgi:hypothetical protein